MRWVFWTHPKPARGPDTDIDNTKGHIGEDDAVQYVGGYLK